MTFLTSTPMKAMADGSLSDLLVYWIAEQFQHDVPAQRERPAIGIMAASGTLRDGRWPVYGGDAPIAHAILEAGGLPSYIPPLPFLSGADPSSLLHDDHTFALFFDLLWPVVLRLDGLVLSGGGDLSGCLSGQQPHPQSETPDLWRDLWERSLALLAWLLCIPTLGICRGMHFMNVALGGTIYQDLRTQWPKDRPPLIRHRARGRVSSSNWVTHSVQLGHPDSRLALAVKGRGEPGRLALDAVLSMHHQAVETLAPGLETSATAADGVIEAFEETSSCRWWVGIQFHPEWSTQLHWVMGLFGAFIDAGRAYSAIPREEIKPLLPESRQWLRERDRLFYTRVGASTLSTDTLLPPITTHTPPLARPIREAV